MSKKWNRQAANFVDSARSDNGVWLIDTNFSFQLCPSSNFKRSTTLREPSLLLSSGERVKLLHNVEINVIIGWNIP